MMPNVSLHIAKTDFLEVFFCGFNVAGESLVGESVLHHYTLYPCLIYKIINILMQILSSKLFKSVCLRDRSGLGNEGSPILLKINM